MLALQFSKERQAVAEMAGVEASEQLAGGRI